MTGPNREESQPQPILIFVDAEIRDLEGTTALENGKKRHALKHLTEQDNWNIDEVFWQKPRRQERKAQMTNLQRRPSSDLKHSILDE